MSTDVDDTLLMLSAVVRSRRSAAEWERLEALLTRARQGFAEGDRSGALAVLGELDDFFGERQPPVRLGSVPTTPAPRDLHDRAVELVETLTARPSASVPAPAPANDTPAAGSQPPPAPGRPDRA